ncbi:MAG: prolyl oligopeptidase family serine peptidase [Pseudomonadota bacterium]
MTSKHPTAPTHITRNKCVTKFGIRREDPYSWMKPADWQKILRDPLSLDGEIKNAIGLENAYAETVLTASPSLSREISQSLKDASRLANLEVGVLRGEHFYYESKCELGDAVFKRRHVATGQEMVMLSMAEERGGKPEAKLAWGGPRLSHDGQLFAWAIDETGSGDFAVKVKSLYTDQLIVNDLHGGHGGFALGKNSKLLFWVGKDSKGRPNTVWRRDLETGTDHPCFESDDLSLFIDVKTSASGEYVFIRLLNGEGSEVWFLPSDSLTALPRIIEPKTLGHDYEVEYWRDHFVIRTNADGADDYKVVRAPIDSPDRSNWCELVTHQQGRYIYSIHPFREFLVRLEWRDARPHIALMEAGGREHDISFDDDAHAVEILPNQQYESDFVGFLYSSPISPPKLLKATHSSKEATPMLDDEHAISFDHSRYSLLRIDVPLPDEEPIPVTLLSLKSSPPKPFQPLYLYAYGAYGDIVEDKFRPEALALVDRGWTFAVVHVRGGGERGSNWWRQTLKHGKKRTFSDFVACTEYLIQNQFASEGKIVAHGMSAGGLLMGSVYATHPHLWAGVIAQVPFVDVLNTLDDWESHPLGSTPFAIWGDPRVEDDYRYMASYSPYEALKPSVYPALLTTGGVADDRVAFWEPLKFTAKARIMNKGTAPAFCKIGLRTGHLGDVTPEGQLEQNTVFLTFAVKAVRGQWD